MIFPFESLMGEYRELGLVVAVLIGFGFGFVLERAGFGRATKLAGQFYLHDMTVFKVMFGAIVTAMLGLVIVSGLGLVDLQILSESAVSQTYIWPMLVGGFLLGTGFIISGYCPGTSLVATASGNIDGFVTFAGVIVGSVVYSELFPLVEGFHNSGAQGHLFLYQVLGLPPAVVAAAIAVMALAAFFGAEILERIFSKKRFDSEPPRWSRRPAFAALGAAGLLAVVTLFFPMAQAPAAQEKKVDQISSADLAKRIFDAPWKLRILDLREEKACVEKRLPGAECAPMASLGSLGLEYSPPAKEIVLVASGPLSNIPDALKRFPGRVIALRGGFEAWKEYALSPPKTPGPDASPKQLEEYQFQAAVHRAMTGSGAAPPPPRKAIKYVPKARKKTGGCG
jgi:uncharacterized membrane protein YedE/YeeE